MLSRRCWLVVHGLQALHPQRPPFAMCLPASCRVTELRSASFSQHQQ